MTGIMCIGGTAAENTLDSSQMLPMAAASTSCLVANMGRGASLYVFEVSLTPFQTFLLLPPSHNL